MHYRATWMNLYIYGQIMRLLMLPLLEFYMRLKSIQHNSRPLHMSPIIYLLIYALFQFYFMLSMLYSLFYMVLMIVCMWYAQTMPIQVYMRLSRMPLTLPNVAIRICFMAFISTILRYTSQSLLAACPLFLPLLSIIVGQFSQFINCFMRDHGTVPDEYGLINYCKYYYVKLLRLCNERLLCPSVFVEDELLVMCAYW